MGSYAFLFRFAEDTAGRIIRTTINMVNATASRIGVDMYAMVIASACPMIKAPTSAPDTANAA